MARPLQKLQRFFRELKRRNVYQVAVAWACAVTPDGGRRTGSRMEMARSTLFSCG